jgi:hypothetical protein
MLESGFTDGPEGHGGLVTLNQRSGAKTLCVEL